MKLFLKSVLIITILSLCYGCNNSDQLCSNGTGNDEQISDSGKIVFHSGLGKLVISCYNPGTIDGFDTYVPCNLAESDSNGVNITEGVIVYFSGNRQGLDRKSKPQQVVAGEELFKLFITDIRVDSIKK